MTRRPVGPARRAIDPETIAAHRDRQLRARAATGDADLDQIVADGLGGRICLARLTDFSA